jgi:hypothetical protein
MRGFKGKLVQVEFWDHCIEPKGEKTLGATMRFKVWGRVEKLTKKEIVLRTWELQNGNKETRNHNSERSRILLSTVIDIRFLELLGEIRIEGH